MYRLLTLVYSVVPFTTRLPVTSKLPVKLAFVAFKLPTFAFAVTVTLASVPTDVMLGCALVVTVPAYVA